MMTPGHEHRLKNPRGGARGGFTLIELLVTVAVLLILLGATYTLAQRAIEGDRISGAARQVRSMLDGGRDRAIFATKKSGSPRPHGVRLIEDPNRPGTCRELVFVGVPGGLSTPVRIDLTLPLTSSSLELDPGSADGQWFDLFREGVLGSGTVIRTGPTTFEERYFFSAVLTGAGPDVPITVEIELADQSYDPTDTNFQTRSPRRRASALTDITAYRVTMSTGRFDDRLGNPANFVTRTAEVGLNATPLADEQPRTLPKNVVIDLKSMYVVGGSRLLPPAWLDAIEDDVDGDNSLASGLGADAAERRDDELILSRSMDVLFSSRGTVTGELASTGLLMLPLADVRDLDAGFSLDEVAVDAGGAAVALGTTDAIERRGDERIVCVATQTGVTFSAAVDPTDAVVNATAATGADGLRDNPFSLAERGRQTR